MVPGVLRGAAGLRLRRRADAGADDRRRASRRGRGYGAELLTSLLAQAKEDGFGAVSLSVEPDNPALALYERHGFEKVGERGGAWIMRAAL